MFHNTPISDTEVGSEAPTADAQLLFVVRPRSGWRLVDFGELWSYRELLWALVLRDIKVRYRQTVLGVLWAILQPIVTMLVLWIIFGRLARVPSDGHPYPLFVFAALLPWLLFSVSVTNSTNSLIGSANLITKVYFPRLLIPLSPLGAGVVDFSISFVVLLLLAAAYGSAPSLSTLLTIPLLFGLTVLIVGLGTLLSALTAVYRDFRLVVPFVLQIWFFATPIIYPANLIPSSFRWAIFINPMAGFAEGFRSALFGGAVNWVGIGTSLVVSIAIAIAGISYFVRVERRLVDVI